MLPANYQWLAKEPGPKMLLEFLKIFDVKEVMGPGSNAEILAWAKELQLDKVYTTDSIAWCGLEMALIATRAGKKLPFSNKQALWARNWAKFGTAVETPMLGDVLVFTRGETQGHVCLYIGEDAKNYHCGGGNQQDRSGIVRIAKDRLFAARIPDFSIAPPPNRRRVFLEASGIVSANEG